MKILIQMGLILVLATALFAQDAENLVVNNGDFEGSTDYSPWWIGFQSGEASGVASIDDSGMLEGNNSLFLEIYDGGTAGWHVQFLSKIQLEEGKTYEVSWMAISDALPEDDYNAQFMISEDGGDYSVYYSQNFQLTDVPTHYGPFTFTWDETDTQYDFKFQVGGEQADGRLVWVDSCWVKEADQTSVLETPGSVPTHIELKQNYPNPFNPTTRISYSLAEADQVKLTVYNLLGKPVATLVDAHQKAGNYTIEFLGEDMQTGMYIYTLETTMQKLSRKMTLLK